MIKLKNHVCALSFVGPELTTIFDVAAIDGEGPKSNSNSATSPVKVGTTNKGKLWKLLTIHH